MICFDHQGSARRAAVSADAECDEFCPREAAPNRQSREAAPASPDDESGGCLLVAGGCSAVAALIVGLPIPRGGEISKVSVSSSIVDLAPSIYLPPSFPPFSPP